MSNNNNNIQLTGTDAISWPAGQGTIAELEAHIVALASAAALARVRLEMARLAAGLAAPTAQAPSVVVPKGPTVAKAKPRPDLTPGQVLDTYIGGRRRQVRVLQRVNGKVQLEAVDTGWTIFRKPDQLLPPQAKQA